MDNQFSIVISLTDFQDESVHQLEKDLSRLIDNLEVILPGQVRSIENIGDLMIQGFATGGTLASIASLLWYAYDKIRENSQCKNSSRMRIVLENLQTGEYAELTLDKETDKEVFIQNMTSSISITSGNNR